MTAKIDDAGALLAETWRSGATLDAFPTALRPADMAEAIAIQDAMAAAIGEPVVGWKVAGQPGAPCGRVFRSVRYDAPATLPLPRFERCFLESEFALRLLADLPPRQVAYEREEVAAAAELVLTIEFVGSRMTEGKIIPDTEAEKFMIVADNAAQLGLVVGPTVAAAHTVDVAGHEVISRIDGGEPVPANPLANRRDALAVLVWLANDLSDRNIGLTAGQVVTTGSATFPTQLPPGSTLVADYGALGQITVSVAGG